MRRTMMHRSRLGVSLVELMLAIAVTAMVALGVASMMTTVGSVAEADREARSALLRTHAARQAVRAYVEESLAVLQVSEDGTKVALWLEDDLGPNLVNLLEVRVLEYDPAAKVIKSRRFSMPDAWHEARKQSTNSVSPASSNFIAMFDAFAMGGMIAETTLVSGVAEAVWEPSDETPTDAKRLRLRVRFYEPAAPDDEDESLETTQMLVAFGMPDHRSPAR